ncbi:acyl-CoA dehydrogenase [Streptomyces sp. Da 82-17]|uniref:acyl-CoA dehydrogenase n=1 Tax=Streptomyces sp. Da 82-17 TaxID=3377116 RepID=UPI0038D4161B
MTKALTGPGPEEKALRARLARLEHALGDPDHPGNPAGVRQFVTADAKRRLLPAGERALAEFGLGAELVPTELGGRFADLDALARVGRAVYRRDAALGLVCATLPFRAAAAVWADGSAQQRRATARLLLDSGRATCAYPASDAYGSRPLPLTALERGSSWRLDGRLDALDNAAGAQAVLLFARALAPCRDGHRRSDVPAGHALYAYDAFLLDGPLRDGPGVRLRSGLAASGVRGCEVRGVVFDGHRIGPGQRVGPPGAGAAVAARARPALRALAPSMALGCADTALRAAVAHVKSRPAHGRSSLGRPRVRAVLGAAFADLLLCDSLALAAARTVQLLPGDGALPAAAAACLLPAVLLDLVYDLSALLGPEAYADGAGHGAFAKAARDLAVLRGPAAARSTVAAALPEAGAERAPAALFRPHQGDFQAPGPADAAAAGDVLLGSLPGSLRAVAGAVGPAADRLAAAAAQLDAELGRFHADRAALPPGDRAGPRARALADRYALLCAGAACLGVWREQRGEGFLGAPDWAAAALRRVTARLGAAQTGAPDAPDAVLLDELLHRYDDARSFDLYAGPVGG